MAPNNVADKSFAACLREIGLEVRYPWEGEDWYTAQTARWDALEADGWHFSSGPPTFNFVALRMSRDALGIGGQLFYTTKDRQTAQEIHTRLLDMCEAYAARRALADSKGTEGEE